MADEKKLPAPDVVRHLASSTSVYQTVVADALALIEGAMVERPDVIDNYLEITEHLRIVLDKNEMGSLPQILRCCSVLLGEAVGRQGQGDQS
jgi:hypothetical protein